MTVLWQIHMTLLLLAHGKHDQCPYLLPQARQGYRLGHTTFIDHMMLDGLEDAYDKGKPMGVFAEACAANYHFTRAQQDEFATASLKRAQKQLLTEHSTLKSHLFQFKQSKVCKL